MRRLVGLATLVALFSLLAATTASARPSLSQQLRDEVTVGGVFKHLRAFQAVADRSGGIRASGTAGHDRSANYVARKLRAAGYRVRVQPFEFRFFEELAPGELVRTAPLPEKAYVAGTDFFTAEFSASGDVTAPVQPVDTTATAGPSSSGCESDDFKSFTAGNIALVQRGTCFFFEKVVNAQNAGAVGVIIFNDAAAPDRVDAFQGTLGAEPDITVPVIGLASFAVGQELYSADASVTAGIVTSTLLEIRQTSNVFGISPGGAGSHTVIAGGHLDSVTAGPGINDNGSGTATLLEVARQLAQEVNIEKTGKNGLRNKIRFAFWGGEEFNLLGSQHYVDTLTPEQLARIDAYLNFDMVGSPNYVRFVYDGDGSEFGPDFTGPPGSDVIESLFLQYFDGRELATEPTAFDGRSDYGPFIAVGIPAGGLFTGAEGIKTEEQAVTYGGTAGIAYDPCYHQACDTIDNVSRRAIRQMSDAVAHIVAVFVSSRPLEDVAAPLRASARSVARPAFR